MHPHSSPQDWPTICNMRSTLLHLQFLHCSISQQVEEQAKRFDLIHKDRLLQYEELTRKNSQLGHRNFRMLLIAKLEQLLGVYVDRDNYIWNVLNKFVDCVDYIEEQKVREVSKLYIGNKVMLDIGSCEAQLKIIQEKLLRYVEEHTGSIEEYNSKVLEVQQLEELWKQYLNQVKQHVKEKIEPGYSKYLKRRLQAKERELASNIEILKNFIAS